MNFRANLEELPRIAIPNHFEKLFHKEVWPRCKSTDTRCEVRLLIIWYIKSMLFLECASRMGPPTENIEIPYQSYCIWKIFFHNGHYGPWICFNFEIGAHFSFQNVYVAKCHGPWYQTDTQSLRETIPQRGLPEVQIKRYPVWDAAANDVIY